MRKEAFAALIAAAVVAALSLPACRTTPKQTGAAPPSASPAAASPSVPAAAILPAPPAATGPKIASAMPASAPANPSAGPEDLSSTPERAAVAALLAEMHVLNNLDFQKTLALMADSPHEWVDLNEDGVSEAIWNFGTYVSREGELVCCNGATGNFYMAIIQRQGDGKFKPIFRLMGLGPFVQNTSSHGWRDLLTGWTMGCGRGPQEFLRHDGTTWRREWIGDYGMSLELAEKMAFCPIPRSVLAEILRRQKGLALGTQKVEIVNGCAARGDIGGDGNELLLVQLNSVKVGGKLLYLTAGKKPRNCFVYVNRGGRWENILTQWNSGGFRLPEKEGSGPIILELEPNERGWPAHTRSYDLSALIAARTKKTAGATQ